MSKPVFLIVFSQLLGTSLWFSANSVGQSIAREWGLGASEIGWLTLGVQAGFIAGTLLLSLTGIADTFRSSRIFAVSALLGALCNAGMAVTAGPGGAIVCRFATGLALAGIYPLGMKLVVSWVGVEAGAALGWLVGMLTLGTALPHLIRAIGEHWPWRLVVLTSSGFAAAAAAMIMCLGDGPHGSTSPIGGRRSGPVALFANSRFRASAFGYFGHMWELYAFWTVVPLLFDTLVPASSRGTTITAAASFLIIASGGVGCVIGGRLSRRLGSASVALISLAVSGLMCLVYPLASIFPPVLRAALLIVWGVAVVADSPQFAALSARAVPPGSVGVALAIQNSLGFLVTLPAIALTTTAWTALGPYVAWLLLPGPLLGIAALWRTTARPSRL